MQFHRPFLHAVRALTVAVALGPVACETPADPALAAFAGTYVLRTVDDHALPVLIQDYGAWRYYRIADTLTLGPRGEYTRVLTLEIDSTGNGRRRLQRSTSDGSYVVRGDTLDFFFYCPPNASCVRPPIAWRSGNGELTLAYGTAQGFFEVSRFLRVN